ncbi:MAG: ArnT family glycosyltransferase [Chloroflexota bacterium]
MVVPINSNDAGRGALHEAEHTRDQQQGNRALTGPDRGPESRRETRDTSGSKGWFNHGSGGRGSVPTPAWLGVVFALALAVRLWGITWQLPAVLYYDELKYVQWASDKADGRRLGAPDYRNPSLVRHLFALEFRLAELLYPLANQRARASFRMKIARVTTAILGAATVVLAALTSRVLFGAGGAIITGLLMALSPLHVHLAHLAVNDVPASFFLAASLCAGVVTLRKPMVMMSALAAFLAGLATAAKYNYGVVLLVPFVGLLAHGAAGRFSVPRVFVDTAAVMLVMFAVGACVGMPELVTDFTGVTEGLAQQARIGLVASDDQEPTPVPLLYAETLVRGLGPLGALAAIAGSVALARSRPGTGLAIMSCPLIYLAVMLRGDLFAARFALPLVLVGAVLAGGTWRLAHQWKPIPLGLAALALLAPLVRDVVQHNRLATITDTRVLAEQWLRAEPAGTRVAAQAYALPPDWPGFLPIDRVRLTRFQSLLSPDAERRLECDGTQYVLLASFNYERQLRNPAAPVETGYSRLAQRAEHVLRFSPFATGVTAPQHPDDTAIPFWYMHAYERPGPMIDVYRVTSELQAECPGRR